MKNLICFLFIAFSVYQGEASAHSRTFHKENSREWTVDDFPNPPWDKPTLEAWVSAATPGELKVFNQAYSEYRDWRTNIQNAWFGQTINPAVCKGKLVEIANKYGAWLPALSYKYMREYM